MTDTKERPRQSGEGENESPDLAARFGQVMGQLTMGQKIGAALVALVTFGGLLFIAISASETSYATLYSGLNGAQSSQIVEALKERQIPYELDSATISVPSEQLHEARIFLAGQGLPESDGMGFELFDRNEFGMTAFTQKVNYQRAMEAELSRTIRSIDAVSAARVHLVISERALFQEDQKPSTASVVVTMRPGGELDSGQIRSVRHLVAGAIEGMDARDIAVVDASGEMLAKPRGDDLGGGAGGIDGEEMQTARAIEAQMEARITELLAPLVGAQHVRAKVSAELDTRRVTETSETFDPDKTAIRREQRSEESDRRGEPQAGGALGAATQLTGAPNARDTLATQTSRLNEVVDYEVNKKVRQTTEVGTKIKRLSVAVLVDDSALGAPLAAAADGAPAQGDAAPAPLDTQKLTALVQSAVGFDAARGDQVEVMKEAFLPVETATLAPIPFYQEPAFVSNAVRYGALMVVALLLILFVARPIVSTLSRELQGQKGEDTRAALALDDEREGVVGKTIAQLEGEMGGAPVEVLANNEELELLLNPADPMREHQQVLRAEVLELSEENLERASQVISQWIRVG